MKNLQKLKGIQRIVGIIALAVVIGITACQNGTTDGGGSKGGGSGSGNSGRTTYDPTGTWLFNLGGQGVIGAVIDNRYSLSGAGYYDAGTLTKSGNTLTMRTSNPSWNNAIMGTATLTSNTTITVTLVDPSLVTGTFNGTKSSGGGNLNGTWNNSDFGNSL